MLLPESKQNFHQFLGFWHGYIFYLYSRVGKSWYKLNFSIVNWNAKFFYLYNQCVKTEGRLVDFRQTRPPYNRSCCHCCLCVVNFEKVCKTVILPFLPLVVALIKPEKSDNVSMSKSYFWVFILWRYVTFTLMPCPSMWPKQFWSVQNGIGLTKLIWTWP